MEGQRGEQEINQVEIVNSIGALFVKCSACSRELSKNSITAFPGFFSLRSDSDLGSMLEFECPECSHYQTQKIDNDSYDKISSLLDSANSFNESETASFESAGLDVSVYVDDNDNDEKFYPQTIADQALPNQNIVVGIARKQSDNELNKVRQFREKIKKIDKNRRWTP
jgi:hypothetical protein